MRPSFLGAGLSTIIATIATILFLMNYKTMSNKNIIKILLLISIAFGIHAQSHYYEEIYYDYNPLVGKWKVYDETHIKK